MDPLADLKDWDDYSSLYQMREEYGGVGEKKSVGGGIRSECWRKNLKASVAEMFLPPLGDEISS